MSQNQSSSANNAVTPTLWHEFFTVAQHIGQQNLTLDEKADAITQLGLHYRMRALFREHGPQFNFRVQSGPFTGMQLNAASEHMSACLARLLGCYEQPLHPYISAATAKPYQTLINIGAGEGYYAVGMARLMPQLNIVAADSNPTMQQACKVLADANEASDRIEICGAIHHADLARMIKPDTLIICDIEGAEEELLNPAACPQLLEADIIVEMHDVFKPTLSKMLPARFAATHHITIVDSPAMNTSAPSAITTGLNELDTWLLQYEGRAGPTPWGVFLKR